MRRAPTTGTVPETANFAARTVAESTLRPTAPNTVTYPINTVISVFKMPDTAQRTNSAIRVSIPLPSAAFTVIIAMYADTAGMRTDVISVTQRLSANTVAVQLKLPAVGDPQSVTAVSTTGSMDLEKTESSSAVCVHRDSRPVKSPEMEAVMPSAPVIARIIDGMRVLSANPAAQLQRIMTTAVLEILRSAL